MQCSPTKHVFSGAAPSEPAQPLWLPQTGRTFLVPSDCETALQRTINGQSANETHAAALDGTAVSDQLVLDALSCALCATAGCFHPHWVYLDSVFIGADCSAADDGTTSGATPLEPAEPLWLPQTGRAFLAPSVCETERIQRTMDGQSADETHAAALDIAGSGQLVLDALSSALYAAAACLHLRGLCLGSVFIRADCFAADGAADCGTSAARVCGVGADGVTAHYRAVAGPSGDGSPNAAASDDAADDAESGYSTGGPWHFEATNTARVC